jgi:phosphate acetyltransferase
LIDAPHSEAAAARAVQLVHEGKADLLMKGSLHRRADASGHGVGNRSQDGRRISHVFIMDVPTYPETLFIADRR